MEEDEDVGCSGHGRSDFGLQFGERESDQEVEDVEFGNGFVGQCKEGDVGR